MGGQRRLPDLPEPHELLSTSRVCTESTVDRQNATENETKPRSEVRGGREGAVRLTSFQVSPVFEFQTPSGYASSPSPWRRGTVVVCRDGFMDSSVTLGTASNPSQIESCAYKLDLVRRTPWSVTSCWIELSHPFLCTRRRSRTMSFQHSGLHMIS